MQRVAVSGAFAALAYRAAAGVVARDDVELSFVDQKWADVTVGDSWPVKWSAGNGNKVVLSVKNATWEHEVAKEEAAPGEYEWKVDVPHCGASYTLEVKQDDCESLESPDFMIKCKDGETEWKDGEWSDSEKPSNIIVVYYEEDCSCTKSKETPAPTHNKPSWYDDELKCTVTSEGPAPTGHKWDDSSKPADASKGWGDASKPADASKGWGDASKPADASKGWGDASKPADASKTWGDAPAPATGTDAAHTWADVADASKSWGDSPAPATTGTDAAHTWADNVAPATATSGAQWVDASGKPVAPAKDGKGVADYKGAATQLTTSFGALAAVFLAALAL